MENKSNYSEYVIAGISASHGRLVYASSKSNLSSLSKDASKARRFRYPSRCRAHLMFLNEQHRITYSDVVFHIYERKIQAADTIFVESDKDKIKALMEEIKIKDLKIKHLEELQKQLISELEAHNSKFWPDTDVPLPNPPIRHPFL